MRGRRNCVAGVGLNEAGKGKAGAQEQGAKPGHAPGQLIVTFALSSITVSSDPFRAEAAWICCSKALRYDVRNDTNT